MKKFLLTLWLFLPVLLFANYSNFESFQSVFTQEEIAFKLQHYLQKSQAIENHFLLTDEAFYLFASFKDKQDYHPEFILKLSSSSQPHSSPSFPASFKGLRIAIDPGHLGGDFALFEQRYIKMLQTKPSEAKEAIFFKEGTLALLTALKLKHWLELEGAIVYLTKEKDGQAVYEKNFFAWWFNKGNKFSLPFGALFSKYYNRLDLQARVDKINAFQPHLTLIIHYNAHGERNQQTLENEPGHENYNMVFIGGSFCQGELETFSSRYEFLRLLLTEDLTQSLHLSEHLMQQFTEILNVPPVSSRDPVPYLYRTSLRVGNGVYARNLFLTRLIHGPLCYGESLCQDHWQECIKLNAKDLKINGIEGPKRVEQVAQAYYKALKAFIYPSD